MARNEFMDDNIYEIFLFARSSKDSKISFGDKISKDDIFDDAQIVDGIILKEKHTWMVVKTAKI